jgi:hypothetical protein
LSGDVTVNQRRHLQMQQRKGHHRCCSSGPCTAGAAAAVGLSIAPTLLQDTHHQPRCERYNTHAHIQHHVVRPQHASGTSSASTQRQPLHVRRRSPPPPPAVHSATDTTARTSSYTSLPIRHDKQRVTASQRPAARTSNTHIHNTVTPHDSGSRKKWRPRAVALGVWSSDGGGVTVHLVLAPCVAMSLLLCPCFSTCLCLCVRPLRCCWVTTSRCVGCVVRHRRCVASQPRHHHVQLYAVVDVVVLRVSLPPLLTVSVAGTASSVLVCDVAYAATARRCIDSSSACGVCVLLL